MKTSQDFAFWVYFFIARLRVCAEDYSVSPVEFRRWALEALDDLADFIRQDLPVPAERQQLAEQLAEAMQAFIFHQGPDPDALPLFRDVLNVNPGT